MGVVVTSGRGTWSHYDGSNKSRRVRRITAGSTSTPVQYLTPITPWFTSIPNPSITLQPRFSASRRAVYAADWG